MLKLEVLEGREAPSTVTPYKPLPVPVQFQQPAVLHRDVTTITLGGQQYQSVHLWMSYPLAHFHYVQTISFARPGGVYQMTFDL